MSTTSIIILGSLVGVVLLLAIIAAVIIARRRGKAKGAPPESPATTIKAGPTAQSPSSPAAPPKFIHDPPSARKSGSPLPALQPLPHEKSLLDTDSGTPGRKIRILVVDDNEDTTENVSRLIYFENDMEVIGQAYTGRQGVEMAVKTQPHIVLMDINMPDMDGITATERMRTEAPFSQVIIMSVQSDSQYMRQAMAAGARDFQPKPFTADELVSCVRRVYKIGLPIYQKIEAATQSAAVAETQAAATPGQTPAAPLRPAPLLVVYSPKGGVGTSTIATNLAVAWQQAHHRVALVDADFQFGDTMVHLNLHAARTLGDLLESDAIDAELVSQVLLTHPTGLKLLLPPPRPEMLELIKPSLVHDVLAQLKSQCQMAVIDTSSKLSDQILAVLDMADHILLATVPELPALKSAKLFLELLQMLEISVEQVDVVVNRANEEGAIPPEQIKKVLKLQKLYYIPDDFSLRLATNRGQSIFEAKPDAPSARAIAVIAKKIWPRVGASKTPAEAAS